jgi:hypothetical protein
MTNKMTIKLTGRLIGKNVFETRIVEVQANSKDEALNKLYETYEIITYISFAEVI